MAGIVDRYLLRRLLRPYGAILVVVIMALSLEMLPRLLAGAELVEARAPLVFLSLACLLPEYLAIALPVAVFLATALAFRRLALNSELDALAAGRCGTWRLMRMPLLLGMTSCLLVIGLRGFAEPAGERRLDSLARAVAEGRFGYRIDPSRSHALAGGGHLLFTRLDGDSGRIRGVVIANPATALFAAEAVLRFDAAGELVATLSRGHAVRRAGGGAFSVARFATLRIALPGLRASPQRRPTGRDRLDRASLATLVASPSRRGEIDRDGAWASASARISAGLLCLLLPLLGAVHGTPPKRSSSAMGLALGLAEILAFWKISAGIEDHAATIAVPLHLCLLLAWAASTWWLVAFSAREGAGAIEARLATVGRRAVAALFRTLEIQPAAPSAAMFVSPRPRGKAPRRAAVAPLARQRLVVSFGQRQRQPQEIHEQEAI